MSESIQKVTLNNGLRVLMEPVSTVQSVSIGFWVNSGNRYETPEQRGIAHCLEHMLFKGTPTRTPSQIAEEIEGRGGGLNAGTGRESTCYLARVLSEHTSVALDVLTDIFLNSLLDPEELEREKGVILEEMKMYEDSPGDIVHDLFGETHWQDHPLGQRIIGVPETLMAFTREMLVDFIRTHYTPDRVVIAAAGNLDPEAFAKEVEVRLGGWNPVNPGYGPAALPVSDSGSKGEKLFPRDIEQTHFCYGGDGLSLHDERRYALALLNSLLGGSMFSRLWQEVREKRGLAYDIGSYASYYSDRGLFVVYGGTSDDYFDQVIQLVRQELDRLCQEPVSARELDSAKNQLKGTRLLALESMQARMDRLGAEELVYGRVTPVEEMLERVEAVQPDDLHRLAQEIFHPDRMTLTAVNPEE
ncbi:MAG: insulinase family protein [Fimbriimonadia bacterium]|nr:insulinase family protein [Fimbriimonadia bacterium]